MTKQQIFSLYLANENQKVSNRHGVINLDYRFMLSSLYNSPDSQLVLKPIAEISLSDCREAGLYVWGDLLEDNAEMVIKDYLTTGYAATLNFTSTSKINEWLITHGYALDNTWFTNGIAIKESK